MGALPNVLTGYQGVTDEAVREKFGKAWNCTIPEKAGLTVSEMMAAAGQDINAMYIMGENPVLSDADASHVAKGLENLDFLVVQDIFLTETARYADVVLPAACFAEKDGTFCNTERRVQRVRKAVAPPGEALADWEIICRLANAMGYEMNYSSPREILDEIADLTPSMAVFPLNAWRRKGSSGPVQQRITQEHHSCMERNSTVVLANSMLWNILHQMKFQIKNIHLSSAQGVVSSITIPEL